MDVTIPLVSQSLVCGLILIFFHGRHSLIWEFSIPMNVSYEELEFVSLYTSSQFAFFYFAFNLAMLFALFARLNIYLFVG